VQKSIYNKEVDRVLFNIDPLHSIVEFAVQHLQICVVKGRFAEVRGSIELDPQKPEHSAIQAQIKTASIYTGSPQRDAHLRSIDFFNVEQYPTIQFTSTKIKLLDQKHCLLTGDLSIHGITRPVQFQAAYTGTNRDPLTGAWRVGLSATTTIDRRDYGMSFNRMSENAILIGNTTRIEINVEATQALS
jgi:polyisoprenoid-binding protein YceI